MSHYYNVRVTSAASGNTVHIRQYAASKRKARHGARVLARLNGMTGRLDISTMRHEYTLPNAVVGGGLKATFGDGTPVPEARAITSNPALAAPYGGNQNTDVSSSGGNESQDVYAKFAGSIFPVVVVRVTPKEDPAYKSVRFHVKDANGRTIKNCKTKAEADAKADAINTAGELDS